MEAFEETGDDDDPNDKVTEIQLMKDYASFFAADDQNDSDIKRAHRKSFVQKCNMMKVCSWMDDFSDTANKEISDEESDSSYWGPDTDDDRK
jgi:hypothetical protein